MWWCSFGGLGCSGRVFVCWGCCTLSVCVFETCFSLTGARKLCVCVCDMFLSYRVLVCVACSSLTGGRKLCVLCV